MPTARPSRQVAPEPTGPGPGHRGGRWWRRHGTGRTARPYRLARLALLALVPGFGIAHLGGAMSVVAVMWMGVQIGPPSWRGAVAGAALAAWGLPTLAGGAGLDRWLARWSGGALAAAHCAVHGGCLAALGVLALQDRLKVPVYLVLLAGSALLGEWGRVGRVRLLDQVLPPSARRGGDALLGVLGSTALIVGPVLAGLMTARFGAAVVVVIDAAGSLLMAAVLAVLAAGTRDVGVGRDRRGVQPPPAVLAGLSGLRPLLGTRGMPRLLAVTVGTALASGVVAAALPGYLADGAAGPQALGLLWSMFGLGALLGGLGAGKLGGAPIWPAVVAVTLFWAGTAVLLGVAGSTLLRAAALVAGGVGHAVQPPLAVAYLHEALPPPLLGPVGLAWASALMVSGPAGYLAAVPMIVALGGRGSILACGAVTAALAATTVVMSRAGSSTENP